MRRVSPSLRRRLAAIAVTISTFAFVVCAALVIWITMIHRSAVTIISAMERVRIVEESEISLLLQGTAPDALIRNQLEEELKHQIGEARRVAVTDDDAALVKLVEDDVTAYLAAPVGQAEALRAAAYDALEKLADANMHRAEAAHRRADRWNDLGDMVALLAGSMLLALTVAFLLWLKRRAFQPVFSLAEVMQRFGRGDRAARAGDLGYDELELMSERFNEMADALAAQRDAQIAFLGGVAHDLRGPLGALSMSLEMLRTERSEPKMQRAFELADRQIHRLQRMIGDFLDTAKIDAGTLELRLQLEDAARLVHDVVEPMRASSPNHEIICELPAEPVPVRCDPVRFEQVVSNLVTNAIKYSPRGGMVRIVLTADDRELTLVVSDSGLGIAEKDRARLFEPFQRVGETKNAIAGVGLGLFIVRRIVEAHGGRVDLESAPGKGSTFTVRIPRATELPQ